MATDGGAFPVWMWGTLPATAGRPAREVHSCATPAALGISTGLAEELQDWAGWADHHQPAAWRDGASPATPATDDEWQAWRARGRILADRLATETGDEVVYLWPAEGRDDHCPDCGPR